MARATKQDKQSRRQYSAEYKTEALALAARVGPTAAAEQIGVHESQLLRLVLRPSANFAEMRSITIGEDRTA